MTMWKTEQMESLTDVREFPGAKFNFNRNKLWSDKISMINYVVLLSYLLSCLSSACIYQNRDNKYLTKPVVTMKWNNACSGICTVCFIVHKIKDYSPALLHIAMYLSCFLYLPKWVFSSSVFLKSALKMSEIMMAFMILGNYMPGCAK